MKRKVRSVHSKPKDKEKQLDTLFSNRLSHQQFKEDSSYVQSKRDTLQSEGHEACGDNLDIFLQDYEGPVPSCEIEEVKEFCEGTSSGGPKIWLDDREKSTGFSRKYAKRLTATDLGHALARKRFDLDGTPDADRRLIYISDLDAECVRTLAESASWRQVPVLRDAIWKHIALQTSLCVKTPRIGFPVFELVFQLPYLALRQYHTPPNKEPTTRIHKTERGRMDVSFLNIPAIQGQVPCSYVIHEAQISIVACGSDNSRWVTYAFVDTEFDDNPTDDDGIFEEEELDELNEDPIADDGECSTGWVVDADKPIWDPREYFLLMVERRMTQIFREWIHLVRKVQRSVKRYEKTHPAFLSPGPSKELPRDVQEALYQNIQTMQLLKKLREQLSTTIQAWKRFAAPTGDIRYFSNMSKPAARKSLNNIIKTFERLVDQEKDLDSLAESCSGSERLLTLRLNLKSYDLNLQTVRLNHNTQEVTLENNRVALESQKTAQLTNQTAALTLSTNQLTIPPVLVIAYFSTQQQIFSFDRNQKTFFICIITLFIALKLYNYGVIIARTSLAQQSRWPWWLRTAIESISPIPLASTERPNTDIQPSMYVV
ncbi:uncharacterized protein BDR25DRAFT_311128 [Lindgomyces ingoldianus]|uniref:Uncharacterized protein n=1 Tax=Lindgomyces ingoldianus TaxID=673940 RepID=A0ACB6R610_9PLEO|nr:uncharacterized protein BDR25DRAFT_311128 [Lindgomyces ingoldianus]KAF2474684.1 hypothetical protein BDR25DRAFT_311128 [Lindgomyces ingoldianus]